MRTSMLDTEPLAPGTCEWCGKDCELEDAACSLSCEAQLVRLEAAQGRLVIRTMKKWRKHRGRKGTPGEGAISEVATLVDGFNKQDRLRREKLSARRRRVQAEIDAKRAERAAKKRKTKEDS